MSHTITIRISDDLKAWLDEVSQRTGVPRGRIIREHLERARTAEPRGAFLHLAGTVTGPRDLSTRKGFSPS